MNKKTQTKGQPNQTDQLEYKDQPLFDKRSKKRQGASFGTKVVKSFKDMELPQKSY